MFSLEYNFSFADLKIHQNQWLRNLSLPVVEITVSRQLKPTELRITNQKSYWKSHINWPFYYLLLLDEDWPVMFFSLKSYRYLFLLIHRFTISVLVLVLPVFLQLLLRNRKILSKFLFRNGWTQHADSRWQQEGYFTSTLIFSIIYFQIGIIFQWIIISNQTKYYQ